MSMAEKLAWAEAHGVTPPEFVVAAAKHESAKAATSQCPCCKPAPVEPSESCCRVSDGGDCCASDRAAANEADGADSPNPAASSQTHSVILLEAMKCQGMGDNWFGLGASVLPPTCDWNMSSGLITWIVAKSTPFVSVDAIPASPPPRSQAA